jgi:hypothetical protein
MIQVQDMQDDRFESFFCAFLAMGWGQIHTGDINTLLLEEFCVKASPDADINQGQFFLR